MKTFILGIFLALSVLSFSRYIESCRVTGSYTCTSTSSGKEFQFISDGDTTPFRGWEGTRLKVIFEGKGYKNLLLISTEELD